MRLERVESDLSGGIDYGVVHGGDAPVGLGLLVVAGAGGVQPPPLVLRVRVTRPGQAEQRTVSYGGLGREGRTDLPKKVMGASRTAGESEVRKTD